MADPFCNRPDLQKQRMKRWRHTSYIGSVASAQVSLGYLTTCETATDQTKLLARQTLDLLAALRESLKERVDG